MATKLDFSQKSLIIITGASKGIGRALALEIAKVAANGSAIILIARSEKSLQETSDQIKVVNSSLETYVHPLDLSHAKESDYAELFKNISERFTLNTFVVSLLIHNAGSVGVIKDLDSLSDVQLWRDYYEFNFFSVIILNNLFLKTVRNVIRNIFVVNISSLVGTNPFLNMGMYGSGKAARNLYFRTLAMEETNVKVLNYQPGPVDTDMLNTILQTAKNPILKKQFDDAVESKSVLSPQQTSEKLLFILKEGKFESGAIIDYFDEI